MTRFRAALAFLTRLPVDASFNARDTGRATAFFPLVGAVIGFSQAAILAVLTPLLPPLLAALCVVVFTLLLTGAIHLDGLADMADGFGGGRSREDVLRIMKDPAVGSFGAIAIVLLFFCKGAAISVLAERRIATTYLVLASTLSRLMMVALSQFLPYARSDGLGLSVREHSHRIDLFIATATALAITGMLARTSAVVPWIVAVTITMTVGRLCYKRLRGFTGDTLGANAELIEAAILLTAVVTSR